MLCLSQESHLVVGLLPGVQLSTRLLCFSSRRNKWSEIEVERYMPGGRPWGGHGVVAMGTGLVWTDLSCGLLSFDFGEPGSQLHFLPLPDGWELPSNTLDLEKRRYTGISCGMLCFTDISCMDSTLNVWTLVDRQRWRWECGTSLEAVWADTAYGAAGLPQGEVPAMAFVHPEKEDVVFLLV
jgi:hypothetical protein